MSRTSTLPDETYQLSERWSEPLVQARSAIPILLMTGSVASVMLPTEYSSLEQAIYCDCGRVPYSSFSFKCKAKSHSINYERFKGLALLQLLEELPSPGELNILILGETGVGKSTFINAFVNYLVFATLEEGMNATRLNSIIPCSFSTQYVDPASGGRLVQKQVKIGYDDDERDGAGQSATQKTTVYPLYINHTLVRLIDTPGIGDTRGIEQDRKNMVDVPSVLRKYDKLHGILILLKPNIPSHCHVSLLCQRAPHAPSPQRCSQHGLWFHGKSFPHAMPRWYKISRSESQARQEHRSL